jgi:hypothetical protein
MAFFKLTRWKILWSILIFIVLFYIESYALGYLGLSCTSLGLPQIQGQPLPPAPPLSPQCAFYKETSNQGIVMLLFTFILAYILSCTAFMFRSQSNKTK